MKTMEKKQNPLYQLRGFKLIDQFLGDLLERTGENFPAKARRRAEYLQNLRRRTGQSDI
jgi:hypothetical protein